MLQPRLGRMFSKSKLRLAVSCTLAIVAAGCSSVLPWSDQPVSDEVNMAFVVHNNLLYLPSVTVDSRAGRFFFSTASPRTVLDPKFAAAGAGTQHAIDLNNRGALALEAVNLDLHGAGDAMIGAEAWNGKAITVDYHAGLLTWQKSGIFPDLMTLYQFRAEPMVNVLVDGNQVSAIVDTASPDTLEIPSDRSARIKAQVTIAGSDLGIVDIALSPSVSKPRIGNRLLSKFLVSIDYGRGMVGLWRDPRNG